MCVALIAGCGGDEPATTHSKSVANIVAVINRCPSLDPAPVLGERDRVVRCLLVAADNDLDDILAAEKRYRGETWALALLNRIVFDVPRAREGQRDGMWPLDVRNGRIVLIADPTTEHEGYSFEREFLTLKRRYGRRNLTPFRRQKLEGFVDPPIRVRSRRNLAPRPAPRGTSPGR